MDINLTWKDFGFKRGHIASNRDTEHCLLFMTKEDYKEIIKDLIQVTKQRIRSRERKREENKAEKTKKKESKLIAHQVRFLILDEHINFEHTMIYDEMGNKKNKEGLSQEDLLKLILDDIAPLKEKQEKEQENDSEDSREEDLSDKSE